MIYHLENMKAQKNRFEDNLQKVYRGQKFDKHFQTCSWKVSEVLTCM